MTNDLKNFLDEIERVFDTNLQLHDPIAYESLKDGVINYHNSVLDLVEKEVEKKYGDGSEEALVIITPEIGFVEQRPALKDISTIINNLRV